MVKERFAKALTSFRRPLGAPLQIADRIDLSQIIQGINVQKVQSRVITRTPKRFRGLNGSHLNDQHRTSTHTKSTLAQMAYDLKTWSALLLRQIGALTAFPR